MPVVCQDERRRCSLYPAAPGFFRYIRATPPRLPTARTKPPASRAACQGRTSREPPRQGQRHGGDPGQGGLALRTRDRCFQFVMRPRVVRPRAGADAMVAKWRVVDQAIRRVHRGHSFGRRPLLGGTGWESIGMARPHLAFERPANVERACPVLDAQRGVGVEERWTGHLRDATACTCNSSPPVDRSSQRV